MLLTKLIVSQFRNIYSTELKFSPTVNMIEGNNGSGKTSLLEAIYYLGHAKSFRTPHSTHLIKQGEKSFVLYGELGHGQSIGIQRSRTNQHIKIAKQLCEKKSELAKALPIQIINPDVHKILEDSPRHRRRFLDWGVFHVEHSYWEHWKRYQSILKQRNAALKKHWDKKLIFSWNDELATAVKAITQYKFAYVNALRDQLDRLPHGFTNLHIEYQQGWAESQAYVDSLAQHLEADQKTGFTKYGPHRSDLKITINDIAAKDVVSRGQQKFLASVLKIAQVGVFRKAMGFSPLFLVDDIFSELDRTAATTVMDLLLDTGSQLLITAIDAPIGQSAILREEIKMFHVEHGVFQEVV